MQGQTIHHINSQEVRVLHALCCGVVDVEQSERGPFLPVVSHQFLGFVHIQEKVVVADSHCEKLHYLSSLSWIRPTAVVFTVYLIGFIQKSTEQSCHHVKDIVI